MTTIEIHGVSYHYELVGQGPAVLFGHCLTWNHHVFEAQVAALAKDYTLILPDQRGHGQTSYLPQPYTLDDMAQDLVALVQQLDLGPVHYVGHSMGAMMGPILALNHASALRSMTLIGGSAAPEAAQRLAGYRQLVAAVRAGHHAPVAERLVGLFFSKMSRATRKAEIGRFMDDFAHISGEGLHWTAEAVFSRQDLRPQLSQIDLPTLVLVGAADGVTSPEQARELADGIPNARLLVLPRVGHFLPVEAPHTVTGALRDFWESLPFSNAHLLKNVTV
jgi:pimeloyl-ACP methyl ester carboxylesterase